MSRMRSWCGLGGAFVVAALLMLGCEANPLKTFVTRATDLGGVIYVGGATASDANPGTASEPLATIRAAIDLGGWYLEQELSTSVEVRVAEGTYEQPDEDGHAITLVEGVSLYGGYAPDFAERDPTQYVSTIVDTRTSGDDVRAIIGEDGITRETVIDGFTIVSGSASSDGFSRAIGLEYASPTISGNVIDAGTGNAAVDVYRESDPLIEGNTILGSSGSGWKYAVMVASNSVPVITGNTIHGGENPDGACTAVLFYDARGEFTNNTVYGGDAGSSASGVLLKSDSSVTITDCEIDGGSSTGDSVTAIEVDEGSYGRIERCEVYAGAASSHARGLFIQRGASAYVSGCTIVCGSAVYTTAVHLDGAEWTRLDRNRIDAGSAGDGSAAVDMIDSGGVVSNSAISGGTASSGGTHAIRIENSDAYIFGNTICAGSGTTWAFGVSIWGSGPRISNNILFTAGAPNQKAIHEHDTGAYVERLVNNLFYTYDAAMVAYFDWDDPGEPGDGGLAVADLEMVLLAKHEVEAVSGNIGDDGTRFAFEDEAGVDADVTTLADNDWRFTPDPAPHVDVYAGGTVLDAEFLDDLDGVLRSDPWSIGAYEYDGP